MACCCTIHELNTKPNSYDLVLISAPRFCVNVSFKQSVIITILHSHSFFPTFLGASDSCLLLSHGSWVLGLIILKSPIKKIIQMCLRMLLFFLFTSFEFNVDRFNSPCQEDFFTSSTHHYITL